MKELLETHGLLILDNCDRVFIKNLTFLYAVILNLFDIIHIGCLISFLIILTDLEILFSVKVVMRIFVR